MVNSSLKLRDLKIGEVYTSEPISHAGMNNRMIILFGGDNSAQVNTFINLIGELKINHSFGSCEDSRNYYLSTTEEKTRLKDALINNGSPVLASKIFITPKVYELW